MIKPMTRILMAGAAMTMLCAIPVLAQTPAALAGAAPATPAATAPAAAAAAPTAAAAAVVPPQAVDPDQPPPVLPTTGDGAAVVKLLAGVCKPLVEGKADFDTLAKASGMTKDTKADGDTYTVPLSQRPFQISITKPSNQNLTTCEMHIVYAPGWDQPIIDGMNVWRFLHTPQMHRDRSDIETYKDAERTTITWNNWDNQGFDGVMVGLVLVKMKNPDGSALHPQQTDALIQYSVRTPLPETVTAAKEYRAAVAAQAAALAAAQAQQAQAAQAAAQAQQAQAQQQAQAPATPATPPAPAPAPPS